MLKNISNLGKLLNKEAQKGIHGGRGLQSIVCNQPYFKSSAEEACQVGFHPHPTMPHCICCRD